MQYKTTYYCFFLLWVQLHTIQAQVNTSNDKIYWTEDELNSQKIIIDASKEKLIGNIDKALELYQGLVDKKRSLPSIWYEIARLYHVKNNDQDALIAIDKAIQLDPTNEWYYLFKTDIYEQQTNYLQAASTLKTLLANQSSTYQLKWRLAYLYIEAHDYLQAIEIYDELEKTNGIQEETTRKKYNLYLKLNKKDLAIKSLENYLEVYHEDINIWHLLATHYEQNDQRSKANKTYKKILKLNPSDAKAILALSRPQTNDTSDHDTMIHSRILKDETISLDDKIKGLIPYIKKLIGHYDKDLSTQLIHMGQQIVHTHPSQAKSHALLGDIYFHSGFYKKAQDQYTRTLELDKTVYEVWLQYLYTFENLNQWQLLFKIADQALDIFPNKAELYILHGLSAAYIQNDDALKSSWRQAKIMARNNKSLMDQLATLSVIISYHDQDKSYLETVKEMSPLSINRLAEYFLTTHKSFDFLTSLSSRPAYTMALLKIKQNKYNEASVLIDKIIEHTSIVEPSFMDISVEISKHIPDRDPVRLESYKERLQEMQYRSMFDHLNH